MYKCVCVFVNLVSPEVCLCGNIYFLFPAVSANGNLIHPGEGCGAGKGGSGGKEAKDEIGMKWECNVTFGL